MQIMLETGGAKHSVDAPFRIGARISGLVALRDQIDAVLEMQGPGYHYAWVSIAAPSSAEATAPRPSAGFH